jgi:hypothetical protein
MSKLAIEIDRYHSRISVIHSENLQVFDVAFNDLQDHRCIEQLESTFTQHKIRENSYEEYSLCWFGNRSTLLPENLFQEGEKDHFYELCFGKPESDRQIDFDRIPVAQIANVYDLPEWIERYFSSAFPKIIVRHEGSVLVEKLTETKTEELQIILSLHMGHFILAISKSAALVYYATFDYQSADDIVYHLMFTLQQKELVNHTGQLTVFEGAGIDKEISTSVKESFGKIAELSELEVNSREFTNIIELCE